jgi:tetratricopeptide (TPR) repeat protein
MPATGTVSTVERSLWSCAIGIAEDGNSWSRLHTEILPLARRRLPDDARVRLATVVAQTYLDLGRLRRLTRDPILRQDVLREENLRPDVIRRIPAAIKAFEALLSDAALAGEVELRIGFLELRRRHWSEALARFDAARAKTSDHELHAIADYLAGWVHEQNGRDTDAIAAYRRALVHYPTVRNLATQLSALLFLRNERGEAYAILDRALSTPSYPVDLWIRLERGDSRLVAERLAALRQGLK